MVIKEQRQFSKMMLFSEVYSKHQIPQSLTSGVALKIIPILMSSCTITYIRKGTISHNYLKGCMLSNLTVSSHIMTRFFLCFLNLGWGYFFHLPSFCSVTSVSV